MINYFKHKLFWCPDDERAADGMRARANTDTASKRSRNATFYFDYFRPSFDAYISTWPRGEGSRTVAVGQF